MSANDWAFAATLTAPALIAAAVWSWGRHNAPHGPGCDRVGHHWKTFTNHRLCLRCRRTEQIAFDQVLQDADLRAWERELS